MSGVINFDTLAYAKALEAKGFTTEQAEALAEENKRVFNEFAETQLATKKDLFLVKEELKADIALVKEEVNTVKLELAVVKWASFSTFGIVIAIAVKQFFG